MVRPEDLKVLRQPLREPDSVTPIYGSHCIRNGMASGADPDPQRGGDEGFPEGCFEVGQQDIGATTSLARDANLVATISASKRLRLNLRSIIA